MDEGRSAWTGTATGLVAAPLVPTEPGALEWFECLDCGLDARCEPCRQDARAEAFRWLHELSESFEWNGLFPPD
jgi:hypothetical protein